MPRNNSALGIFETFTDLEVDETGSLWVAVEGQGVWRIPIELEGHTAQDLRNFTVQDGLTYNTVEEITVDREGIVWFATNGGGLAAYLGDRFDLL